MTIQNQPKTGTSLNQVTGNAEWFLVEYNDGTASIHPNYDEAYSAGQFQDNADQ